MSSALLAVLFATASALRAGRAIPASPTASAFRAGRAFPASPLVPVPRLRAAAAMRGKVYDAAARAAARVARATQEHHAVPPVSHSSPQVQSTRPAPVSHTSPQALSMQPAPAPKAQTDGGSVALVLTEFVRSDYARQLFDYCNVQPTDYGQLGGMFESVQLVDTKLVIKLSRAVEQRSDKVLDRLAKHLRTRMPQIERLQYESGSPPTTRTIII